jgi:hypothetical protein
MVIILVEPFLFFINKETLEIYKISISDRTIFGEEASVVIISYLVQTYKMLHIFEKMHADKRISVGVCMYVHIGILTHCYLILTMGVRFGVYQYHTELTKVGLNQQPPGS